MEGNLLLSNIRSVVPIKDSDWQFISSFLTERSFKKGDFLNREGEVSRFTNFIGSGSTRAFHIDANGNERDTIGHPGLVDQRFRQLYQTKN